MKKNIMFIAVLLSVIFGLTGCSSNYTITFETNTSNIKVESITAKAGEKISSPEISDKDGYRFNGWLLNNQTYNFDVMPEENLTLTASWAKLYNITFYIDGEVLNTSNYIEGEKIDFPETPQKYKQRFNYWQLDDKEFDKTRMIPQDLELTAVYEDIVTVYFDTGIDGQTLDPISGTPGERVVYPYMPTKEGYRFAGWSLNYSPYTFYEIPDEDIRLEAIWEKTDYTNFSALYINIYDYNWVETGIETVGKEEYVNAIYSLENSNGFDMKYTSGLIKGRGNGSWNSDKKGYRIKFDTKETLFGVPESRHWVLLACYSGDFTDSTMMRNALAYQMGKEYFDNIDYTTSANWVDVYVNNEYYGAYLLVEHVRDASDRVNVDGVHGVLDTGYLIEYDAYAANGTVEGVDYFRINGVKYGFTVKSPAPDEYLENGISLSQYKAQISYLQQEVQKLYTAALTKNWNDFSKYADVDSFVDMYILHELFKNTDAGWSSFYISREAGGKFKANVPWDFDASAGISRGESSYTGIYVGDTIQQASNNTASELFINLYNTKEFKELVIKRWKVLSPDLYNFIDVQYSLEKLQELKVGMGKNYATWMGEYTQSTAERKWLQDAQALTSWLSNRIVWLDSEWV